MFLTQLIYSPYFYTILAIAVALLAAFNLFEILFLMRFKRRLDAAEAWKEQLRRKIAEALIDSETPAALLPSPRRHSDYEAYSEAAGSIMDSFDGEIARRAADLISRKRVDRYYMRLARDMTWYKRAHAIDILASMRLKQNKDFFLKIFLKESSDQVKYRILYGLSLLTAGKADLLSISRMLSTLPYLTPKYTEDIFFNAITALKNAGRETEFTAFLAEIEKDAGIAAMLKRDSISACDAAGCEHADGIVKDYYAVYRDEPELLIACIKTLARMGDFSKVPAALEHPDWRVQLTALKYAHLCGDGVFPAAAALLRSPNYHVRLYSAAALARHGEAGRALLSEAAAGPDSFAAAAARYALEDAGGAA